VIAKIKNRLIAVREALGIKQREFCKGIYVSQSYYAQIESGTRPINDRIIALICAKYDVSKEYLETGEGGMFIEDLPDIQLKQLLDIYNKLEKPFKDYIVLQIKQLFEALGKNKEDQELNNKKNNKISKKP
jgi:transcriptional regulator with XRE-family HTH domain